MTQMFILQYMDSHCNSHVHVCIQACTRVFTHIILPQDRLSVVVLSKPFPEEKHLWAILPEEEYTVCTVCPCCTEAPSGSHIEVNSGHAAVGGVHFQTYNSAS